MTFQEGGGGRLQPEAAGPAHANRPVTAKLVRSTLRRRMLADFTPMLHATVRRPARPFSRGCRRDARPMIAREERRRGGRKRPNGDLEAGVWAIRAELRAGWRPANPQEKLALALAR